MDVWIVPAVENPLLGLHGRNSVSQLCSFRFRRTAFFRVCVGQYLLSTSVLVPQSRFAFSFRIALASSPRGFRDVMHTGLCV